MIVEKSLELLPSVHLGHGMSPGLPSPDDRTTHQAVQGSLTQWEVRRLNMVACLWVADDLGLLLPVRLQAFGGLSGIELALPVVVVLTYEEQEGRVRSFQGDAAVLVSSFQRDIQKVRHI